MAVQKWEYKTISGVFEGDTRVNVSALDLYGDEGWELVTVLSEMEWQRWVFKRPIDDTLQK